MLATAQDVLACVGHQALEPQRGRRHVLAVVRLSRAYSNAPLVFDRSQAEQLSQAVQREGVRAVEYVFRQANANRLAKGLFVALRDRSVDLGVADGAAGGDGAGRGEAAEPQGDA